MSQKLTRRRLLQVGAAVGVAGLAGCSSSDGTNGNATWGQLQGDSGHSGSVPGTGPDSTAEWTRKLQLGDTFGGYEPRTDRDRVYVARAFTRPSDPSDEGSQSFVRVWATTTGGSKEWETDVQFEDLAGPSETKSLSVSGGTLVVPTKKVVVGLDTSTGEELWRVDREVGSTVVRDGTVYGGRNGVWALSAEDGTERWSVDLDASQRPGPGPALDVEVGAVDDQRVYLRGLAGMVTVPHEGTEPEWTFFDDLERDEYADDRARGEPLKPYFRYEPVVAGGTVYLTRTAYLKRGFAGWVTALDAATGDRQWRFRGDDDAVVSSAPVVADGTLYVAGSALAMEDPPSETGTVYAVDTESGSAEWSIDAGNWMATGFPAAVGSRVYVPGPRVTVVDTGSQAAERTNEGFERALLYRGKQFAPAGGSLFATHDDSLVALEGG